MTLLTNAFVAANVVALVLLFAAIARRLLAMRFGLVRMLLAGALAFAVASGSLSSMLASVPTEGSGLTPFWFFILSVAISALVAMVFLALAEALVPTGSVPGPLEFVRGFRGRVARTRRYLQILRIAIRNGLGPLLRGRQPAELQQTTGRAALARSVRQALDEGGVTFVKLGQVASTRPDLLPPEFVAELSRLRDQAAPAPWEQVEQVLTAELGGPVEEVFAAFDRAPLAAASIAQVHTARLRGGEEVIVKVQRPGIRAVVEPDLDIVARLARRLETTTRWGRTIGVRELARGFADAVGEELDFRIEARNMAAVAAAPSSRGSGVVVPTPYEPLCTERVLVMQHLHGTPLAGAGDRIAERGLDRTVLARTLLDALLRQVMLDGVFHADPHPGNVLLLADGRLGLLDFGSVGRLDTGVRAALQRLLLAMDRGDPLGVSDALLEVVPRPDEIDQQHLERALGQFMARNLGPGMTPSVRMFTELFGIVSGFGLSVPAEVAAVFRALATLEGALAQLAPGFEIVTEARAFASRYLTEQLDADTLRRAALDELVAIAPMLRRLPRRLDRIVSAAEHGRMSVNVRLFADERDRQHVASLLHQVLLAALGSVAGIMAVMLLGTDGGPVVTEAVSLHELLGYNLLVISAVLVLRVLVLIFRPQR